MSKEIEEIFEEVAYMKRNNMKYMDWEKAKKICEEHPDCTVWAGLRGDMGNTGGKIYDSGEWCHDQVYDRSFWATPILEIISEDDDCYDEEEIECWTIEPHEKIGLPDWWGQ